MLAILWVIAVFGTEILLLKIPKTNAAYTIANSARFVSGNSDYLSKTFSSAPGNSEIGTLSVWVKRGDFNRRQTLFAGYDGSSGNSSWLEFGAGGSAADNLSFAFGGSAVNEVRTSALFRDPAAWVHIVAAWDTTQATASNRVKLYINGVQATALDAANYPAQNATFQFALANANNRIGQEQGGACCNLEAYLADAYFIDGQALTPSSFGKTDSNGYWRPIAYTGTYGTNGFHLNFSNGSSLGTDSSGNGNNWTVNGLTSSDQVLDSPTDSFATGNPIAPGGGTYSSGNLSNTGSATSTILMSTGKWYWEVTANGSGVSAGVVSAAGVANTVSVSSGTTMGFKFDADAGELDYTTDGTSYTNLATGLTGGRFAYATGGSSTFNFGQGGQSGLTNYSASGGSFKYQPPNTSVSIKEYLTSGTSWTVPSDWNSANNTIKLVGGGAGGGGGGGASSGTGGGGGGGGGNGNITTVNNFSATAGAAIAYGLGGAGSLGSGGASNRSGNPGSAGGSTTFDSGAYSAAGGGFGNGGGFGGGGGVGGGGGSPNGSNGSTHSGGTGGAGGGGGPSPDSNGYGGGGPGGNGGNSNGGVGNAGSAGEPGYIVITYTPTVTYEALSTANLSTPAIAQPNKYFDAQTYSGNAAAAAMAPQIFTTSGTFTVPSSYSSITVIVNGAGGGGGGGGGAGSGTNCTGGSLTGGTGSTGGTSTFGSSSAVSATGGTGGGGGTNSGGHGTDGSPGTGSGGSTNSTGNGDSGGAGGAGGPDSLHPLCAGGVGNTGAPGGQAIMTWSSGASGAPTPNSNIAVTVGTGGTGGGGGTGGSSAGSTGSTGNTGSVIIGWGTPASGGLQSITSFNFQPDLVWLKDRSATNNHGLFDSLVGATKYWSSNTNAAETTDAQSLMSFLSNGFSIGTTSAFDTSGDNYISWAWKKQPATDGFDIETYTGTGTAQNISHSLGAAPDMIIVKRTDGTGDPAIYDDAIATPQNNYLLLDSTAVVTSDSTYWNNTAPTASVFTVGTNANVNASGGSYVAYLFKAIPGFSAFGSYTGNGSTDGPFVYSGFDPRFILFKNESAANDWYVYDTARDTYNPLSTFLSPDTTGADTTTTYADALVNGFKVRSTNAAFNASGDTYVYAAFAEEPFYYSAQPAASSATSNAGVSFLIGMPF